ncbi:MAG: DUF177 domain-containing protein [Chloroflexi bacterium]|nr:DUF177 domain-containing protein [Chloroflexota bacterium]
MYLNVSQLLRESSGANRSFQVDEPLTLAEGTKATVRGTVRLLRTDRGIWVSAALESEAIVSCSRCLTDHAQPVHMLIEEEFFTRWDGGPAAGTASELSGDEHCRIDEDHVLDLTETIRQFYSLEVPMQPVCRRDCAGICLTCGVNLNETRCGCDAAPPDPRWGALLELASSSDVES